jgi:hypothetical protein
MIVYDAPQKLDFYLLVAAITAAGFSSPDPPHWHFNCRPGEVAAELRNAGLKDTGEPGAEKLTPSQEALWDADLSSPIVHAAARARKQTKLSTALSVVFRNARTTVVGRIE